ncbi:hypothetical protein Dsin_015823 [Dipteronia sinensis]|uniref:Zinc knuckle CX2CX4HX4C domain-containing protein n=1 Tax=Dipteronia sinensis TaxID=43782 RepID=A0AAE0E546_9ROSI|nr:hypothetical protein Dsin_015823 [Dipteronia sinensis]
MGSVLNVYVGAAVKGSGKFLWLRIKIDVTQPLRRCLRVDVMGYDKETVMVLRYERLPKHCFRCGRFGHLTSEYMDPNVITGDDWKEVLPYGVWLRRHVPNNRLGQRSLLSGIGCNVSSFIKEDNNGGHNCGKNLKGGYMEDWNFVFKCQRSDMVKHVEAFKEGGLVVRGTNIQKPTNKGKKKVEFGFAIDPCLIPSNELPLLDGPKDADLEIVRLGKEGMHNGPLLKNITVELVADDKFLVRSKANGDLKDDGSELGGRGIVNANNRSGEMVNGGFNNEAKKRKFFVEGTVPSARISAARFLPVNRTQ